MPAIFFGFTDGFTHIGCGSDLGTADFKDNVARRQGAPCNPFLSVYVAGSVALSCYDSRKTEDEPMAWTTPVLVEICIGLEINGYLPAEL